MLCDVGKVQKQSAPLPLGSALEPLVRSIYPLGHASEPLGRSRGLFEHALKPLGRLKECERCHKTLLVTLRTVGRLWQNCGGAVGGGELWENCEGEEAGGELWGNCGGEVG